MRLSLEYIAAFLDCDGCVSIVRYKRKKVRRPGGYYYYPKVYFSSQNLPVLGEIKEVVGGAITPKIRSLMCHMLQLSPKAVATCLRSLLPYLRIKNDQAVLALEMIDLRASVKRIALIDEWRSNGGSRIPDEIHKRYAEIYDRMRVLNHRDSKAFRSNPVNSGEPSKGEAILSEAVVG